VILVPISSAKPSAFSKKMKNGNLESTLANEMVSEFFLKPGLGDEKFPGGKENRMVGTLVPPF